MSNVQSYNALIDRFKAFASGHFILKSFSHGQIDTADLEKFTEYPFMHVVPSNVTYAKGTKTFSFQIVLADLPRDKEDKVEFQREVLSDLQRIAEDLVAEITNHRVLFGELITVQNVSLEPFLEEFHNTLTGWTVSLDLLVPYYWDACSIPAEWNDMFESGSGGTGSILTFIDSITRDENGNVSLVNDEATPAPNYYYGTNDEGVRGWYLLTDEVGLTCATIGTCQTIIDIEAEIDLLQQDVTDLQADVVAIETELPNKVPYTGATANVDLGEYELKAGQIEFDTTPTGTAGAAVMRWNDTDGTVDVGLKGGNVTLQVGQESVVRVVNKAGADLLEANYQAVRVRLVSEGGAQGQRLAVVLALADTDADSATTIGLVTETINNNQEGFVTTSGEVRGINTTGSLQGETWVDGDILYLSGTTAGRVTNVKPSAPTHTIIIGYVVYAHQNNGKIFVKVDNGYELDELHNVSITSPTDNQALVYESASSLWKNETIDKTFVGLGNVDNTSDANKPVSTATQTALNLKENSANKQNSLAIDGSGTKFPTVDAVNNLSFIDKFKRGVQYFTDLEGRGSTVPNFTQLISGTGATTERFVVSVPNASINQIGFCQYQTGTTATGYAVHFNEPNVGTQFFFGGGAWIFETFVCVETLSDATNRFRFITGFGSAATNGAEGNGAFFTYDEGATQNGTAATPNWQTQTCVGSVRTLTTTSTVVTAGAWVKLRIEVNAAGTQVLFYINGTLVATHTTNIPTWVSAANPRGFNVKQSIAKTIGTTNRSVFCDYLGYENRLTTAR